MTFRIPERLIRKPDVRDVYFIFADDVFASHITYEQFTTILKFYLLLYRRILIADSFLLNNAHLQRFLLEEGKELLGQGLIVLTARTDISSIDVLHHRFKHSDTLNDGLNMNAVERIMELYDFKKTIQWDIHKISRNFRDKIHASLDILPIPDQDAQKFAEKLEYLEARNLLTRQSVYHYLERQYPADNSVRQVIKKYTDIVYSFNIPNSLGTASAYPERLLSNELLSPEKVFFHLADGTVIDAHRMQESCYQSEDLISEDVLKCDHPLMFYTAVLNRLGIAEILELRKIDSFTKYLDALKENAPQEMKRYFYVYCEESNKLAAAMISEAYLSLKKTRHKLSICSKVEDSAKGIISFALNFIPMPHELLGPLADTVITGGISLISQKAVHSMETEYSTDIIDASREAKRLTHRESSTILHKVADAFQINKIKEK